MIAKTVTVKPKIAIATDLLCKQVERVKCIRGMMAEKSERNLGNSLIRKVDVKIPLRPEPGRPVEKQFY